MNEISFKGIAKMIEGYIELLSLFPYFNEFTLEQIEATDTSIQFTVSTSKEIMKMPLDPKNSLMSETHKTITSFYITQDVLITKGDLN